MKNKILLLIAFLTVTFDSFAAAGAVDVYNNYRHWIYPAYLYNLKFGVGFLIGFAVLYFVFRKQIDERFNRISSYLRSHRTLAVIVCGVLIWVPFGIIAKASDYWFPEGIDWDWITLYAIVTLSVLAGIMILLACGRFRNRVLITPLFLKVMSAVVLAAICASALFIILTKAGVLDIDRMVYYTYRSGGYYAIHPFDSVKSIWSCSVRALWLILYSLIILWIGNAYRWLRTKRMQ